MEEVKTHKAEKDATITVGADSELPLGRMGGSVHRWSRYTGGSGGSSGWIAEDWCGNQIGFVADGSEMEISAGEDLQIA